MLKGDNMWIKNSENDDVYEYVKKHPSSAKLAQFKERLGDISITLEDIYTYRFERNKSFREIESIIGMDAPRIKEAENAIVLALRIEFKIF